MTFAPRRLRLSSRRIDREPQFKPSPNNPAVRCSGNSAEGCADSVAGNTRVAEDGWLEQMRAGLLGELTGEVLEIGAGTGANLRHYQKASGVVALEPSRSMRRRLENKLPLAQVPVRTGVARAEALPFPDASFDAVVSTLVLCSVEDQSRALAQIVRVLKPGGRLVFIEHVRSTGPAGRWQDRLAPVWSHLGAGCQPNRRTRQAIEESGLQIEQIVVCSPQPCLPITSPIIRGLALKPAQM